MKFGRLCVAIALALPVIPAGAADPPAYPRIATWSPPDLAWVPRTLAAQPAFASAKVRWCLLALGDGRKAVLTLAWDESAGTGTGYDTLYADTNLDGKLGGDGERFVWSNDPAKRPDPKGLHELYEVGNVREPGSDRVYVFRFAGFYKPDVIEYDSVFRVSSAGLTYEVGPLPGPLQLLWGDSLATAPVYRFGGEAVPEVNGKHAGETLGTWKAGDGVSASVFLAHQGSPAGAQLRFYGAKHPSLPEAVRDNRWGKAGYPIVLLRVLDPATGKLRETIPFGDSCPCAGGFAPRMLLPSRVPAGNHEVVVRVLRVPELGGCADYVWPVTVVNPFAEHPLADAAFADLRARFPEARLAALRRVDSLSERAPLHDVETVVPTLVADTTLLPINRDWDARHASTGGDPQFGVGRHPYQHADLRTLLRFDLSGVPKGTEILAARLRLALISSQAEGASAAAFAATDALEAFTLLRPWNERQDDADGYACWFGPRFRGALRETWGAEGADQAGTDREAKPCATTSAMAGYPAAGENVRLIDLDLTEQAKAWQAGTRPNHGVLLRMRDSGGGWLAASEVGDHILRPTLLLAYRGADPAPTWTPRPGEDVAGALARAAQAQQPLVLRFYQEKCAICARIEATTFRDPRVVKAMDEVIGARVDIERQADLAERLGVEAVPTLVVLAADGQKILGRLTGEELARAETLLPLLASARPARPRALLPRSRQPIVLDGVADEAAWTAAGTIAPFLREDGGEPSAAATRVLVLAADDALYLAGICPEPKPEGIVAQATADDTDQVWKDDNIEFFLEPLKGGGEERQFAVSASGKRYDSRNGDKAWNVEWTASVKRQATGWSVELRIPWAALGLAGAPAAGTDLGFNAGRTRNADREGSQWSLTGAGGSHQPVRFGTLAVP